MKTLFAPAEAVMNRASYPLKFGLLGVIIFVAFASLMLALANELNATADRTRRELVASSLSRPLSKAVELMQQHRGLSSAVLSGAAAMADRRAAKEQDVDRAMTALADALPADERESAAWKSVRERWNRIKGEGQGWAQAESFAAHTVMIGELLAFQVSVADAYGLTFDPEQDSFYLMSTAIVRMPYLLERAGQLRAKGAGVLARGSADEAVRLDVGVLSGDVQAAMRDLETNGGKIAARRPDLKPRLETTLATLKDKLDAVQKVAAEIARGDIPDMPPSRFFDLATETITVGYSQMYDILLPTLDELLQQRIDRAERTLYFNVGMPLAVLLLVAYFSAGAYFSIIGSIRRLVDGSRRFAAGDLATRIELDARDELRLVAGSFNDMAVALRTLISNIQGNSGYVADAAKGMAASSQQIDRASLRQSEAASSMAAAVEQMISGIEQVSGNAGNANELARESGKLSREGGEIVASVVQEISQIAESVGRSAQTIEELGRSSEQISAVVGVIKEIADQTNLLALNAAIEAARAGEQGRGFAVVADEVRKLAERTTQSTAEIAQMVAAIQAGARESVESMHQGVTQVNAGVARARQAGESMAHLCDAAGRVADTVAEISGALREQSAASAEIAKNVETIARMTDENAATAAESHHTADRLENLAGNLLKDVQHFRVA